MVAVARSRRKNNSESNKLKFTCEYCKREFSQERTLFSHICEPGRRAKQKDLPHVRIGFYAYNRFYELTQNQDEPKSYQSFCESAYYLAFVRFGQYTIDVKCPDTKSFIDWVIKSEKPIDKWNTDTVYAKFLQNFLITENYMDAAQRTLMAMADWSDEHKSAFNHYFKYATSNRIIHDILMSNISPWIIYCSDSGKEWLSKLDSNELEILLPWINPDKWAKILNFKIVEKHEIEKLCINAGI